MGVRSVVLLVILAVLAVFAAVNWAAFTVPTHLSVLFGTVQAPLGVVMLGVVGVFAVFFLAFVVHLQTLALFEARRQAREVQAQRDLADHAEVSRFTELRALLEREMASLAAHSDERHAEILARLERIDRDFGAALERTESAMAAYIGELDERVRRGPDAPTG